jgi:hypothetical protein
VLVCGVCLGVFAAVGGFAYIGYRVDRGDAVAALESYLDEIKASNYSDAYDRLCDGAKEGMSVEEYAQRFHPPRLVGYRVGEVSMVDQDGESGYDIAVALDLQDGQAVTETFFVFSRASDVDRYYVCPPGL